MGSAIVAICPYCRVGGVRASEGSIGKTATCPKCHSNFTIIADRTSTRRKKNKSSEPEPEASTAPLSLSELPSLVSGELAVPDLPAPKPIEAKPTDPILLWALLGSILIGPISLAFQLPAARALCLGMAGVGVILAILAMRTRGSSRTLPALMLLCQLLIVIVLVFLPKMLGVESDRTAEIFREATQFHAGQPDKKEAPESNEPIDASNASWQSGDVKVSIPRLFVGAVELTDAKGAKRRSKESSLQIVVRSVNRGFARRLSLTGWVTGQSFEGVRLSDSSGTEIKLKSLPAGSTPTRLEPLPEKLLSGQSVETILIFDLPSGRKNDFFVLELPASSLSATGTIRFRLPSSLMGGRQ
jgi:hypothetical protein